MSAKIPISEILHEIRQWLPDAVPVGPFDVRSGELSVGDPVYTGRDLSGVWSSPMVTFITDTDVNVHRIVRPAR